MVWSVFCAAVFVEGITYPIYSDIFAVLGGG